VTEDGRIFVFGSNRLGIHGAGAAKHAAEEHGAKRGRWHGLIGTSYAIPTKATPRESLPLNEIAGYVQKFLQFARQHPDMLFAVTRIGCGFAGYTDEQIGPMFASAPPNCELPFQWWRYTTDDSPTTRKAP